MAKSFRKRKSRARTRKRNQGKNVKFRSMVSLGAGLPKKVLVTHRYVDQREMTSTLGGTHTLNFSCNGMYDPDVTGVGHQPLYFDQFTALYRQYTVIGSKIHVKFVCGDTTALPYQVGIFLNDDTTTVADTPLKAAEQTSGKTTILTGAKGYIDMTRRWSAKKYFGGSIMGNDNLQGTIAQNPAEQTYYTIQIASAAAATQTLIAYITIEYIAIWTELLDIAPS